jgi:hypothetical protein
MPRIMILVFVRKTTCIIADSRSSENFVTGIRSPTTVNQECAQSGVNELLILYIDSGYFNQMLVLSLVMHIKVIVTLYEFIAEDFAAC